MSNTPATGRKVNVRQLALLSLFAALIFLLGFTPLGLIPLGFCNATILHIPVIIGTLLLGLKCGLVLGGTFGAVSFISALIKPSGLVSTLMGSSPVLVFIMSVLPRLCVPAVAWFIYKRIEKSAAKPTTAYIDAAVCGCLVNAMLVLLVPGWLEGAGMAASPALRLGILAGAAANILVGFGIFRLLNLNGQATAVAAIAGSLTNTVLYLGLMLVFYVMCGIDSTAVLSLIGGMALLAGSAEALVASILCTPIFSALKKLVH